MMLRKQMIKKLEVIDPHAGYKEETVRDATKNMDCGDDHGEETVEKVKIYLKVVFPNVWENVINNKGTKGDIQQYTAEGLIPLIQFDLGFIVEQIACFGTEGQISEYNIKMEEKFEPHSKILVNKEEIQ